ncbi:hypothetical protein H0E87_013873, partial [Populus deltoides]
IRPAAVMLLLLFAALGGRIPATVLFLLIAAHRLVHRWTKVFRWHGKRSAPLESRFSAPSLLSFGLPSYFSIFTVMSSLCNGEEGRVKGLAQPVLWSGEDEAGNERSGDGKGGLGREREIPMRARHGAVSGAVGWRRGVCGGCLVAERETNG